MPSTIILKTDPKLKKDAQKLASELGVSLTSVINNSLKKFVEEKSFVASKKNKKKYKDPYGIFANSKITNKDIDEVTHSWDKIVDEII